MHELNEWEPFYIIVGGAAGALIGLQFVVLTLLAQRPSLRSQEGAAAFSTPMVVHFANALLIAALMSAPWRDHHLLRLIVGAIGVLGLIYGVFVVRHMVAQTVYKPVFVDWIYNLAMPMIAYGTLLVSAESAIAHPHESYFGVAGAALLLLLTGICNSWDGISYHALSAMGTKRERKFG